MESGVGVTGTAVFSGSVFSGPSPVKLLRTSSTFLPGERRPQLSYRSREQNSNQHAFVTQCSTSGFNQTPASSALDRFGNQRGPLLGSFGHASEGAHSAVDMVSWLPRTSPGSDSKAQSSADRGSYREASVTEEDALDIESRTQDSATDSSQENLGKVETEAPGQMIRPRGWRQLGVDTAREERPPVPEAFLLKKRRRSRQSSAEKQLATRASDEAADLNIDDKVETVTSSSTSGESYLNGSRFKTFSATQTGVQGRENISGEKFRGPLGAGVVVQETTSTADSWVDMPRSPAVSEGGERLKINLDLELYRGKTLRQKGRLTEAEAILRTCIRDWPDDGRPYVALGRLLLKKNKVAEARTAYEMGCQAVRGENAYIWQAWAVLEERTGNLAKARKLFDAATVADKKQAAAWHGWAKLELREGNVKRATSLLNKGLRFCGPNEYLFQTLALIESRAGRIEQARSLLGRATQHNPKSAASWLAWALMESQNGFQDTARRLFQKGIVASPKNRYVWQAWALFEARQGNKERARELFQRGHDLNPRDAVLLQAFALFEYQCGRPELARDYFRRALVCDPTHQPGWIAWGWMEWKLGNISTARELYQGAIQADSRSMDAARAFQAWGVLEDREGDAGLAREFFKCALKIDSQNVPTWMSWAAMEEREGRSMRADEIRNLFLQQRTEVVDELSWDVDLSNMLAPAIDKIRGFFGVDQRPPGEPGSQSETAENVNSAEGRTNVSPDADEEFDVDLFLRQKFPRKYGSRGPFKPTAILEAIDRSLKKQSRDAGRDERLDIFKNRESSRSWK